MSLVHEHHQPEDTHVRVIDGLRGLAIILIVWFHIWQQSWLSSNFVLNHRLITMDILPVAGFLGVELLLFISGFGLFYPSARHLFEGEPLLKTKEFFFHRFVRIYPSYLLAIVVIMLLIHPLLPTPPGTWGHFLAHLFFVHNLNHNTYSSIDGVLWTLGIEAEFYLIFPLLAWLFRKWPFPIFFVMAATAIIYRYWVYKYHLFDIIFLNNQLPSFLDIYGLGMLAAYAIVWLRHQSFPKLPVKLLMTLLTIGSVAFFVNMTYQFYLFRYGDLHRETWQAQNRFYVGLDFFVLAVSASFAFGAVQKIFTNKILIFLSVISYNLYIWHQVIAFQLRKYNFPHAATVDPHADPVWQVRYTILTVALGVVTATALTFLFERPVTKLLFKAWHKWSSAKTIEQPIISPSQTSQMV